MITMRLKQKIIIQTRQGRGAGNGNRNGVGPPPIIQSNALSHSIRFFQPNKRVVLLFYTEKKSFPYILCWKNRSLEEKGYHLDLKGFSVRLYHILSHFFFVCIVCMFVPFLKCSEVILKMYIPRWELPMSEGRSNGGSSFHPNKRELKKNTNSVHDLSWCAPASPRTVLGPGARPGKL